MTRIYAFRHGESVRNIEPDFIGGQSNSAELTKRGERQAFLAGLWVAENLPRIDFAVSSTAVRTQQTGAIVLSTAGLELELELYEGLLEMSQGEYEGRRRDEVYTPERKLEIADLGIDFKLPGAESMREVGVRKGDCFRDISRKHEDKVGIAFAHGTGLRCVAGLALDLSHAEIYTTPTDNLSLTILDIEDDVISVDCIGKKVIEDVPSTFGT